MASGLILGATRVRPRARVAAAVAAAVVLATLTANPNARKAAAEDRGAPVLGGGTDERIGAPARTAAKRNPRRDAHRLRGAGAERRAQPGRG
jgi:hypothetical protein